LTINKFLNHENNELSLQVKEQSEKEGASAKCMEQDRGSTRTEGTRSFALEN
jgi:hypothetical protein